MGYCAAGPRDDSTIFHGQTGQVSVVSARFTRIRARDGVESVPNKALRQAMADAQVTAPQLAAQVRVDVKTVLRWLRDEERFPHPQHRWAVSDALKVDEVILWPKSRRLMVKTGIDREISRSWASRSEIPNTLWSDLLHRAKEDITLAGWTCYFFWLETANLTALLQQKASEGCHVRFLIGDRADPATAEREAIERTPLTLTTRINITLAELEKLRDVEGLEARYADRRLMGMSVFRFDDEAVVTPHLATTAGHNSPAIMLRKLEDGGLFDRFAQEHVDQLWTAGQPVW